MQQHPSVEGYFSQFASDNTAGMHADSLRAMAAAAGGYAPAYGDDRFTAASRAAIKALFGRDAEVFFMASGTAANCLSLAALAKCYEGVFCHETAHLATDETGAPHWFSGGSSLLTVGGAEGKLSAAALRASGDYKFRVHSPRPRALSIANATETGTVYSPAEVAELAKAAKDMQLAFHVDGARYANACATAMEREGLSAEAAARGLSAGADVLCFGGCKDGIALSDAVVIFDGAAAEHFGWRLKQAGQLLSKGRIYSAPWAGAIESGLWIDCARRANAAAAELESRLRAAGYALAHPREANALFVGLADAEAAKLHEAGWIFYGMNGSYRFMCNFGTTEEAIAHLARDMAAAKGN